MQITKQQLYNSNLYLDEGISAYFLCYFWGGRIVKNLTQVSKDQNGALRTTSHKDSLFQSFLRTTIRVCLWVSNFLSFNLLFIIAKQYYLQVKLRPYFYDLEGPKKKKIDSLLTMLKKEKYECTEDLHKDIKKLVDYIHSKSFKDLLKRRQGLNRDKIQYIAQDSLPSISLKKNTEPLLISSEDYALKEAPLLHRFEKNHELPFTLFVSNLNDNEVKDYYVCLNSKVGGLKKNKNRFGKGATKTAKFAFEYFSEKPLVALKMPFTNIHEKNVFKNELSKTRKLRILSDKAHPVLKAFAYKGRKSRKVLSFSEKGEPLDRVAIDRLSAKEKLIIISDLSKCMAEFHANELVHRDCKPGNVILFRDQASKVKEARMIDFESLGEAGVASFKSYTPFYIPPEKHQLLSSFLRTIGDVLSPYLPPFLSTSIDEKKADVWSLALTVLGLYVPQVVLSDGIKMMERACKQRALSQRSIESAFVIHTSYIPFELKSMFRDALQLDPKERLNARTIHQIVSKLI